MDHAWLLLVLLGQALYVLPTLVAAWRRHPNGVAILVLNLLLGWTGLGWIGALVWACTTPDHVDPHAPGPPTLRLLLYTLLGSVLLGAAVAVVLLGLVSTGLR